MNRSVKFATPFYAFIVIIIINILLVFPANALTILIDPGHGGDDVGAKTILPSRRLANSKLKNDHIITLFEKDLTLTISKKLQEKLKEKDYSAFLTRSFDHNVSLEERANMAEKIKADLFISVHINSDFKKGAHGFETYYLNNHNDSAVKKLENVENQKLTATSHAVSVASASASTSTNSNNDPIISKILIDLVIEKTVEKSIKLAKQIHSEIDKTVHKKHRAQNRKVRPGLFYVLALAKRPSVLLEVGFISNQEEANRLNDYNFQEDYVTAVVSGIDKFIANDQK
ncbi:MAG: N-acetylmuramoyl-L-alanine amidase [Oligoflexia bacterium]|nr:N-acetylmuramoyl-L-alanine amidase [Oligoflexia bacterium]